jgi:hypothetical protein
MTRVFPSSYHFLPLLPPPTTKYCPQMSIPHPRHVYPFRTCDVSGARGLEIRTWPVRPKLGDEPSCLPAEGPCVQGVQHRAAATYPHPLPPIRPRGAVLHFLCRAQRRLRISHSSGLRTRGHGRGATAPSVLT